MTLKEEYTSMVMEYKDVIFKVCYIYAEKEYIDDYYQEVLIQLWRSFPHFRGDAKLSSWIYKISLNTCINTRKRRKLETIPLNVDINPYEDVDEEGLQVRQLYERINKLGLIDRSIILMWLENLSYEEIGAILGISVKNVSVKLVRIREKLKQMSNR